MPPCTCCMAIETQVFADDDYPGAEKREALKEFEIGRYITAKRPNQGSAGRELKDLCARLRPGQGADSLARGISLPPGQEPLRPQEGLLQRAEEITACSASLLGSPNGGFLY